MLKVVAAGAVAAVLPLIVVLLVAASPATAVQAGNDAGLGGTPTALARQDIPADYLAWYIAAAEIAQSVGASWSLPLGRNRAGVATHPGEG